jgi:Uma2 family endonuclease
MATAEALLTAEEFERMPDPGYPTELVRGRIVAMNPPGFRHGEVCAKDSANHWRSSRSADSGPTCAV